MVSARARQKKHPDYKPRSGILSVSKRLALLSMPKARRRSSKKSQRRAIREIKRFQEGKSATRMLVPRSCFNRLAREIAGKYKHEARFQQEALDNIQEAAESHIVRLLRAANKITETQNRLTLKVSDLQLAREILEDKGLAGMKRYAADRPDPWVFVESPDGSVSENDSTDEDEDAAVEPVEPVVEV